MTSTATFLMMSETIEFRLIEHKYGTMLFSVTFGHCASNSVTFGHRFRELFQPTAQRLNSREIKSFGYLKQLTIVTDTVAPALGTRKTL